MHLMAGLPPRLLFEVALLVVQRRSRNIEMQSHQAWLARDAEEREGGVAYVQIELVSPGAAESYRGRAVQSVGGRQQRCDRAVRRDPQHCVERTGRGVKITVRIKCEIVAGDAG